MPPPRRLSWRSVKWLLLATDLVFTTVALTTAYWLRFHWSSVAGLEQRVPSFPLWMMVLFGATFLVAFSLAGVYRRENVISGLDEYGRIFAASAMAVLLVIAVAYLTSFPAVSRGFVLLSLGLVTFGVCLGRFGARRVIYRAASRGRYLETAVVVGVNHQAIDVARQLNQNPSTSTRVIGFLSDYRPKGSVVADGLVVLGEPLELDQVARDVRANRAVVVESGLAWESLRAIVQVMHRRGDLAISLVPGLSNLHSTPMDARQIGGVLTLDPRPARITGAEAVMKRGLDFALVVPSLLVGLPLMVLMVASARTRGHGTGLVTEVVMCPAGKLVLRRFRYPEWADRAHLSRLPELLLVLSGKMSLLGPRPVPVRRFAEYERVMALLESAKPGLIGPWWLVGMGRPDDVDSEVTYDLYYLQNYSLWLDLQLLIRIGRALWRGQTRSTHVQVPHLRAAPTSNPPSDLPGGL
jgi:lipopolysaccharide/colanic/teichoic acid biosynthesis glycosyltransferase